MTASVKSYLFSVIVVCIITAIVKEIAGKHRASSAMDLACGILIVLALLRPLIRPDNKHFSTAIGKILSQTEDAERESRAYHAGITADIIKEKTEAYIWYKAAEEGFVPSRIHVEMQSGDAYPYAAGVTLEGSYTDLQKKRIGAWIASSLAIPEDRQQWHWSKS